MQPHIRYRPDIDGLRAVAVLAVIGYHAAPSLVPGGFAGVDVFFVISGFLISTLLFTEASHGRIDLAGFYLRRIRRLFPALIVVLVACWTLGWWLLADDEYRELEKHVASASVFTSNFTLWAEAGYFDTGSELKPLLHLWSLGIEEQFYLLWPTVLAFAWRRRLNLVVITMAVIAGSFLLNVALVGRSAVATFFLPHTRLWELMLGVLLAYGEFFRSRRDGNILANIKACAGFALMACAIVGLNDGVTPNRLLWSAGSSLAGGLVGVNEGHLYPGAWAIIPTLGATLTIWAGPGAWINRAILARRPLVMVGLISYPLYLWHWPLLSFLRITENNDPSRALRIAAVLIAVALAWLTYVAVERPVRRAMSERTPRALLAVAAALFAIGGTAYYGWKTERWKPRTSELATHVDRRFPSPRHDERCQARFPTAGEYCQVYAPNVGVTTALVGDSHAEHFLLGVGSHLISRGENVVQLGQAACPPVLDIERLDPGKPDRCRAVGQSVLHYVANDPALSRVILSFRGTAYVNGTQFGETGSVRFRVRLAGTTLPAGEAMRLALERTLELLASKQKDVWIFLQVPELGFSAGECVGRPFSFEHRPRTPCAVPKSDVLNRQGPYRAIVQEMKEKFPQLHVFDPVPAMCDTQWCFGMTGGRLLYRDEQHLSRAGSLFFADKLAF